MSKKPKKTPKAPTPPAQQFDPLVVLKVLDDAASTAPLTRQGHINVQQAVKILTAILTPSAPAVEEDKKDSLFHGTPPDVLDAMSYS